MTSRSRTPGRMRFFVWPVLIAVVGIVAIYWLRPDWMLDGYFAAQRWYAGMHRKTVSIAGADWSYVDGDAGEPVLLVHGMGGSKENWMLMAPHLRDNYRLIAPDQAGFGESGVALDGDYRISAQVDRLLAFADALKLERFHLVGHSMGGQIAGVFAARYPERVHTLTLISAAGVPFQRNAFQALLERGENPFATESLEKFDAFMRMTFERPPFSPARLRLAYAHRNAAKAPLWNDILQRITSVKTRYYLQSKLDDIAAPTMVLWCDRDQLLDVSSVEVFRSAMPEAEIDILKGCGHMAMMEQPREVAALLRAHFSK